jgi:xylose isomerase
LSWQSCFRTSITEKGELLGFDLYPYTEDQVDSVRRSVLHWEFVWDKAALVDRESLTAARSRADALAGYRAAYAALGLDAEYEKEILRRRPEQKALATGSQLENRISRPGIT